MPMLFMITEFPLLYYPWIGGSMVIEGTLTLGEIIAFIAYLSLIIWLQLLLLAG